MLVQTDLTSCEMHKVVIQTAETVSTMEATDRLVKILNSTYANADLEQVAANSAKLKSEEINQLLSLFQYFEDLFEVTLEDWDTYPVDIESNLDSKQLNCKH